MGGKESYMAPETHTDDDCDAFLADAFSLGVCLFGMGIADYPWETTRPGGCQFFAYITRRGLAHFLSQQDVPGCAMQMTDAVSPEFVALLAGLLQVRPDRRWTLGEQCWQELQRESVFDSAWLRGFDSMAVVPKESPASSEASTVADSEDDVEA